MEEAPTAVPGTRVTDEDVMAVIGRLPPGSRHRATSLYERYWRAMRAAGRPVATRDMFGRALRRNGCKRSVERRGRGRRGEQVITETPFWETPGGSYLKPDDDIQALVEKMGPGLHRLDLIYDTYLRLPLKSLPPLSRPALMTKLGHRGYVEMRDKKTGDKKAGPLCRAFH